MTSPYIRCSNAAGLQETHSWSSVINLLIVTALIGWFVAATSQFARNRYLLALWFCFKNVLPYVLTFSLGWLLCSACSHARTRPVRYILALHASALLLVTAATPPILSFVNLIPQGQTRGEWQGEVTSYETHYMYKPAEMRNPTLTVNCDELSPWLKFNINRGVIGQLSNTKPYLMPTVFGEVTYGFMGVPIEVNMIDLSWPKSIPQ